MISREFQNLLLCENFLGVDDVNSEENKNNGSWDAESINIFSDPQGALGSRPGFTQVTAASIGSATAWCGYYQFDKLSLGSAASYFVGGGADGKLYNYTSGNYQNILTGLTTTKGVNKRFTFFTLDEKVLITCDEDLPRVWAGSGSATTFATSCTANWGLEWQRYGWLHSVVDPRLLYYCDTIGEPDSNYTSFLNFDEDMGRLTGACKQGDDMLVGKEWALFRVQYRGTEPLYKKYRVPSKIGPVNFQTMKETPNGQVIFLAPDFNFYLVSGDNVIPCGDNIKNYVKAGVNARLQYAVSGLLHSRNQYWCSFSYTSGATTNDRTLVMDWSRPYADKWGKTQYPWFIYSIGANAFSEMNISGKSWLYYGDYTGKIHKNDTGTNDNGVAFSPVYVSKEFSWGDPGLEKKFENMSLNFSRQGDWDLDIQLIADKNALTEKTIAQNLLSGAGTQTLWDNFNWDEANWSSETDGDVTREIKRMGKTLQVRMGTSGLDKSWLVYSYNLLVKALHRGIRTRSAS